MSAPILRIDDVDGEPSLVDVTYGLPDLSQGTIRVIRTLTTPQSRPHLQAVVDRAAESMTEVRAALRESD